MKNIILIILIASFIFCINKIYNRLNKDTFQTIDPPSKDSDIEPVIQKISEPTENQLKELLDYKDLPNSSNARQILNIFNSSQNINDFINKLEQGKKLTNLENKIQLLYSDLSSLSEEGVREDKLTEAGRYRISAYLIDSSIKKRLDKKIKEESTDDIVIPLKTYNLLITKNNISNITEKMYVQNRDSLTEKYI